MSTNKTSRYKMHSWVGTDKVSRQELVDNFNSIDSLMVANSTADTTYYVNASSGNDSNDGLSAAKAFKTIQKAISLIPQILNHTYNINVAAGTYNEDVAIEGITGKGRVYLNGDSAGGNEASFNVRTMTVHQTQTWVSISGFTIVGKGSENGVSFLIDRCRVVNIQRVMNLYNDKTAEAFRILSSLAKIVWCNISNKNAAIKADLCAIVYAENNGGSGNTTGYMAVGGSTINVQTPLPGATNPTSVGYGGTISSGVLNPWGDNTYTTRPFTRAWTNTSQTLPTGTRTKVTFTDVRNDISNYNAATSRFTVNSPGYYLVTTSVYAPSPTAGSTLEVYVYVNGIELRQIARSQLGSAGTAVTGSAFCSFLAGDYVEIYTYASNSTILSGGSGSAFEIIRVA